MMNAHLLHNVLTRFQVSFLAFFPALTHRDLRTILVGERETLLNILQERYGYTRTQAKAAWNEFVLRYVDGQYPTKHIGRCHVRTQPRGYFLDKEDTVEMAKTAYEYFAKNLGLHPHWL